MANAMVDAMHDDRTYRRVEVITGHRRRRDWTPEEKDRIVGESVRPKANISEVARRNVTGATDPPRNLSWMSDTPARDQKLNGVLGWLMPWLMPCMMTGLIAGSR
jgi:hypothetical protein